MRGHGRQATHARAAQQLQHDGFRLVILMMRHHHIVGLGRMQSLIAQVARRRFQALSAIARHLHTHNVQGNTVGSAYALAMLRPLIGMRTQAVVHMHSGKPDAGGIAQRRQQMQ